MATGETKKAKTKRVRRSQRLEKPAARDEAAFVVRGSVVETPAGFKLRF